MTMMKQGGASDAEVTMIQQRAKAAEAFVCAWYDGELRLPMDPVGDVNLPGGKIVNVKSIPRFAQFINAGSHRPGVTCVVVQETAGRDLRIVGAIEPDQWTHGTPDVPGRNPQRCWYAGLGQLRPAPSRYPWEESE
jgi:hypothetical protein